MTRNEVVFTPEAEEHLAELYRYIEENATAAVALSYTSSVVEYCEGLGTFPLRGTPRDDVRPGLRTTAYKRRTEIAYTVDDGRVSDNPEGGSLILHLQVWLTRGINRKLPRGLIHRSSPPGKTQSLSFHMARDGESHSVLSCG
jgi:toxin ParE1/3/4